MGAYTQTDGKLNGSNYGLSTVDLFAPGNEILSCYPCSASGCSLLGHVENRCHTMSGTSMAAPFVTGVAALIFAHNTTLSPTDIKNAIVSSVRVRSGLRDYCISDGRLDASAALAERSIHISEYEWEDSAYHMAYCTHCDLSWLESHTAQPNSMICYYCNGRMQ